MAFGRALALAAMIAWTAHAAFPADVFDIDLSLLTNPPLWEPNLEEYFPVQRGHNDLPVDAQGLASPVVLTSPSRTDFVKHARKGYPILVSDWAGNMTYKGWSCKDFAEKFPFGYMKAEYIDHMPGFNPRAHDIRVMDGEKRFNLGSFKPDTKVMWHNFSRPAAPKYGDDPLKPKQGPYVWHVKDELPAHQKKLVQQRFQAPEFLRDPLNSAWMNRTFEIWFSPGAETGAGAHNDGYCESVVSFQLNGAKKWRKMMMPKMTALDSFDEFDGGVYSAGKWKPDLGFVNPTASAVIWPPGYLHETSTLPTSDGSCGASITVQYAFPQPVQFFRAFLPRLALSSEVGQCVASRWAGYASFFLADIWPSGRKAKIDQQLQRVMRELDADQNDIVTVEETVTHMKQSAQLREEASQYPKKQHSLFFQFKAEDTVAYHDLDGDMQATKQEILDSLTQWNVVRTRVMTSLELINTGKRKQLEQFERSLDWMRREPAEIPTQVRQELDTAFKYAARAGKIFPQLERYGVLSLSDSEFYSKMLDRVQGGGGGGDDYSEDEDDL